MKNYVPVRAIVKVMPCFKGQQFPVAVFVKYHDVNFWEQYSKEYWYKKCAEKEAKMQCLLHYGWELA